MCDHQEHDVNNNGIISKKHQFQVFKSILVSMEEKRFRDINHLQNTVHLRMIMISQRSIIVLMVKSFRSGKCSRVLLSCFLIVSGRNLRYMIIKVQSLKQHVAQWLISIYKPLMPMLSIHRQDQMISCRDRSVTFG